MYSKLRQEKTYIKTIDYNRTKCPVCQRIGEYKKTLETGDIECKCGHIIQTQHQYVAGHRINTNLSYKLIRRHKK